MLVFIRHGEKVSSDPVHLSDIGKQRAKILVDYFMHPYGIFEIPTAIYAMANHHGDHSHRCMETVKYISKELNIPIQSYKHWTDMIPKAKKDTCPLICWEHKELINIIRKLGFTNVHSWGFYPNEKRDEKDCFDATWVVDKNKLNVYRQFDIDKKGNPIWLYPRTVPTCILIKPILQPLYGRLISFCSPYIIRCIKFFC